MQNGDRGRRLQTPNNHHQPSLAEDEGHNIEFPNGAWKRGFRDPTHKTGLAMPARMPILAGQDSRGGLFRPNDR